MVTIIRKRQQLSQMVSEVLICVLRLQYNNRVVVCWTNVIYRSTWFTNKPQSPFSSPTNHKVRSHHHALHPLNIFITIPQIPSLPLIIYSMIIFRTNTNHNSNHSSCSSDEVFSPSNSSFCSRKHSINVHTEIFCPFIVPLSNRKTKSKTSQQRNQLRRKRESETNFDNNVAFHGFEALHDDDPTSHETETTEPSQSRSTLPTLFNQANNLQKA